MKKYLFIIFALILLFSMTGVGCGPSTEKTKNDVMIQEESIHENETEDIPQNETESNTGSLEEKPISFNDLPDDIKGCIIPLDSLMLYHVETGKEYEPTDAYMFWRTLHYALGNFGINYNRAEMTDYELAVESMVIGEFATSFIPDYKDSLPIPEELTDSVRYDSTENMYYFGLGDRGLSQTEILSYEHVDNNTLRMTARLYGLDDNSTICKGDFVLKWNEYANGVIEPLFYYTVVEAKFYKE